MHHASASDHTPAAVVVASSAVAAASIAADTAPSCSAVVPPSFHDCEPMPSLLEPGQTPSHRPLDRFIDAFSNGSGVFSSTFGTLSCQPGVEEG